MLAIVMGIMLYTGGRLENKMEIPCPVEAFKGHGREMIGYHEKT